jgi:hypothetical protein
VWSTMARCARITEEGRATVVPVRSADEFFDKVAGTLTGVGRRPTVPLRTSAIVGTKRLIPRAG